MECMNSLTDGLSNAPRPSPAAFKMISKNSHSPIVSFTIGSRGPFMLPCAPHCFCGVKPVAAVMKSNKEEGWAYGKKQR